MSPKAVARKIARVVQSPGSAWSFSVRHAVNLGRWPHHGWLKAPGAEDRRIAEQAMEEMEVLHLADRDFPTLSGGEAQRVMIAQALAQEPSVLIMDEPVAHLDLHHQISTLDMVRRLSDRGISVLASLHDINLAAMYAHRVIIIDTDGKVHSGDVCRMLKAERIEELFGLKLLPLRSEQHGTDYLLPMPAHLAACS
jgi:iron complex transport system ATP-binding protein